jgi:uncharacterized protein (TIGR02099 family)
MIHFFKSAAARAFTYGLVAVIGMGLLIGAARLALPFADLFRAQLSATLSETLGLEVEMGRLRVRLAGIAPRLTLEDVDLRDPVTGEPQLELLGLHLDLDLLATIRALAPKVESLTLEGARLQVERHADGSIAIAGLRGVEAGDPRAVTFFLGNGRFRLTGSDIHWVDHLAQARPLKLTDVNVRFENQASRHRIGLRARVAGDTDARLHVAADLQGEPDRLEAWSGDLFAELRGGDLDALLKRRMPALTGLRSDDLQLRVWSRIAGSHVLDARALLRVDGPALAADGGGTGALLRANRLDARLHWRPEEDGWRLAVPELALVWSGSRRTAFGLEGHYRPDGAGGWELRADTGGLALAALQDALAAYGGEHPLADALGRAAPGGELTDLRVRVRQGPDGPPRWTVQGDVRDLTLSPADPIPGLGGLDASFRVTAEGAKLALSGQGVRVALPWVLSRDDPLVFARLAARVGLARDDRGLRIEADDLELENADLRLRSRLVVELPAGGRGPRLDLSGNIRVDDARAIRRYVPAALLKPKLRRWLDQAFLAGRVPSGRFLFRGRPADFPFADGQGCFAAEFQVQDLDLKFNAKWPHFESVDGVLRFANARMEIDASAGRILDVSVREAKLAIPDVRDAAAIRVDGSAIGAFGDALAFLSRSPLKGRLGAIPDRFQVTGMARVDLSMSVPLRRRGPEDRLSLEGTVSWPGPASLAPAGTDLQLSALDGGLRFNQQGLGRSEIGAVLWGSPVAVAVEPEPGAEGAPGVTRLTLSGGASVDTLARELPSPLWRHLRGASTWRLDLEIANDAVTRPGLPLDFVLRSDLRGMTVALPAPFGKGRDTARPLRLEGAYRPGQERVLRGHYGAAAFRLLFAGGKEGARGLRRGAIAFGTSKAGLPDADGLYLTGRLAELDPLAWVRLAGSKGSAGGAVPLRAADLRVERLRLARAALTGARLRLERTGDGWETDIASEELAGRVSVPDRARGRPLEVALERLDLQPLLQHPEGPADAGSAAAREGDGIDPRRSHTLELSVERLQWGDDDLGRLTLEAVAEEGGLAFREIRLDGRPLMDVTGNGRWVVGGDGQTTSIVLTAAGEDLGEFLRHLGYESSLDRAPAKAQLRLSWPGGPGSLSLPALAGSVAIEIGKGSLRDVEPGVGRMLGILNLNALQRRLSLDFSDLFQTGYSFERIEGRLAIAGGEADIVDLVIEGPSAEIRIEGKTNLVARELEQVVTVTPSLGTGVALASAVAGGPLVGAAVLIADQVSGGAVDKLGSYQYDVTGPWTEPKIVRRPRFETGAGGEGFLPAPGGAGGARAPAGRPPAEASPGGGEAEPARPEPALNLFLD